MSTYGPNAVLTSEYAAGERAERTESPGHASAATSGKISSVPPAERPVDGVCGQLVHDAGLVGMDGSTPHGLRGEAVGG